MPDYHWKGITRKGILVSGTDGADSHEKLKQKLLEEEVALLSYREKKEIRTLIRALIKASLFQKKLNEKDLGPFFYDLSVLLESGITIGQALEVTKPYTKRKSLHKFINVLQDDISHGYPLSRALARQNKNISQLIIHMIRAGEHSGNLQGALAHLSSYLSKKEIFIKKLRSAAMLPAITFFFALCIIAGLFFFVLPNLEPILSSIPQKPYGTKLLLAMSRFLQSETRRIQVTIGLVAFLFAWRIVKFFAKKSLIIDKIDKIVLYIPYIGKTISLKNNIYVLQTLALLLNSGTPLTQSFVLASKVCTNRALQKEFLIVAQKLDVGKSLKQACEEMHDNCMTSLALGQASGTLDRMLTKTSKLLEDRLDRRIDMVSTIIQPVLLISLGLFIAFIMLSIYLPLFDAAHIFS